MTDILTAELLKIRSCEDCNYSTFIQVLGRGGEPLTVMCCGHPSSTKMFMTKRDGGPAAYRIELRPAEDCRQRGMLCGPDAKYWEARV